MLTYNTRDKEPPDSPLAQAELPHDLVFSEEAKVWDAAIVSHVGEDASESIIPESFVQPTATDAVFMRTGSPTTEHRQHRDHVGWDTWRNFHHVIDSPIEAALREHNDLARRTIAGNLFLMDPSGAARCLN